MKRKLFIIGGSIITLLIIIFIGWILKSSLFFSDTVNISSDETSVPMERGFLFNPLLPQQKAAKLSPSQSPSPVEQKKIIKNGSLTLVVDNTDKAVSGITQMAESKKGFVASLNVSDDGDRGKKAWMSVRVPVDVFASAMEEIKALAQVVEAEGVNGQDVTEQFIDLEAQLKNLRATETQFLDVLKTAKTVEDILKVQDRLSQVRGQIESLEGQLKYLANQTDLATITISLSEEPTVSLSFRDFRPITIIKTSFRVLAQGLIVIFNLLVRFILIVVPILVVGLTLLGVILFIFWRIMKKMKQKFFTK